MTHNNSAMAFLLSWLRKARSDQGGEFVRDSTGATDFSGCQAAEMSSGTRCSQACWRSMNSQCCSKTCFYMVSMQAGL